jgi:hypothetical protein
MGVEADTRTEGRESATRRSRPRYAKEGGTGRSSPRYAKPPTTSVTLHRHNSKSMLYLTATHVAACSELCSDASIDMVSLRHWESVPTE